MRRLLIGLTLVCLASPTLAEKSVDMTGKWTCDPAPILIRGEWTTLTYRIEIAEQRDHLFKGTFSWVLAEDKGVKGATTGGERSFEGKWTALGVIGWDQSMKIVPLGGLTRTTGTFDDRNTIRLVHAKVGKDAWVGRSVCKRK